MDKKRLEHNIKNLKNVLNATDTEVDNIIRMFSLINTSFLNTLFYTVSKIIGKDLVYFKNCSNPLSNRHLTVLNKNKTIVIKVSKDRYKIMGLEQEFDFKAIIENCSLFTTCIYKDKTVYKRILVKNPLIGIVLILEQGRKYPIMNIEFFLHMDLKILPVPRNLPSIKRYLVNRFDLNYQEINYE